MKADLFDLKYPLIRNYLENVNSNLLNELDFKSVEDLAKDMRIADGPKEYFKPLNVGLLFFNNNPEKFFPYCRIELVNIPNPNGQGMEERIFTGPIDQQLRDVLTYIKNNVITEKIFKITGQAEAEHIKNYSYDALEEFISNAIYHRSYQSYEPVTIRIEKEQIEITSIPGPDRSISDDDILNYNMRARRYRNRRIGDFLKELHLVEGRNTGFPTALNRIRQNRSPLPKLITDEERSFFTVIIPIHKAFISNKKNRMIIKPKRKTKDEIKQLILNELDHCNLSATTLYNNLGYSGNISKTFRTCINELISDSKIEYLERNINSSNNLLTKIKN